MIQVVHYRFIPVGTGNTPEPPTSIEPDAVHPRGHGEHLVLPFTCLEFSGSSPWARGTPLRTKEAASDNRFIPVGTGNTLRLFIWYCRGAVHPRGHGEHKLVLCERFKLFGSSPWARGTLTRLVATTIQARFIPVGTGNTQTHVGLS